MDEDLKFNIKLEDTPVKSSVVPVAHSVASTQDQEALTINSSNYDLQRAGHPKACIFTFLFKLCALLTYLVMSWMGDVFVFIIVVILSACDFWTIKNVTGRLLVGLKWENSFNDDGTQQWHFYSHDNKEYNAVDIAFFWTAQIGFTFVWGLFTLRNIINMSPFWVINISIVDLSRYDCIDITQYQFSGILQVSWKTSEESISDEVGLDKQGYWNIGQLYDEIKLIMNNVIKIGHYTYDEANCLGQGAYGKVFEGLNTLTSEVVAIKKLDLVMFEKDKYLRKQIISEIEIISKLNHINIVRFIELVSTKKSLYIVTEMCRNGDLKQLINTKCITEPQALDIIQQILQAFKELIKSGVIHRDMKPANVLNDQGVVKIADFGFAKYVENYSSQLLKSCVGSPLYMAPQVLARQQYSTKCDIWSVGVILYEMLFNDVPWKGRDEDDLLNNIRTQPLKLKSEVSEFSTQFLMLTLQIQEEQRASWQQIFDIFESFKGLPQQIEQIEEECIQRVPSWVQKQVSHKQDIYTDAEANTQFTHLIQVREQIAHKHYLIVELYGYWSQLSKEMQYYLHSQSKQIAIDSNQLILQAVELCGKTQLMKGTLWKMQEQLNDENEYYKQMALDTEMNIPIDGDVKQILFQQINNYNIEQVVQLFNLLL